MKEILLVEDERNLRNNLTEIIELHGYKVHAAENGADALTLLQTFTPLLIISDIYMPVMNGYNLFKSVQQMPTLKGIPFVFLSARTELDDIRHGMNLGADDYITKPVKAKDLIGCINMRIQRVDYLKLNTAGAGTTTPIAESTQHCTEILAMFSKAEMRVFKLLAENKNSVQIGHELFLSYKTVQNHRANMARKLGLNGNNALLEKAIYCKAAGLI
jgi:two-component system, OmpR family, response regulator